MKYLHFLMVTYFKRLYAFLSILRGVQVLGGVPECSGVLLFCGPVSGSTASLRKLSFIPEHLFAPNGGS